MRPDDVPASLRPAAYLTIGGSREWVLLDAAGRPYTSSVPGAVGGHRRTKVYGRLDCPAARRWLARGYYAVHRVFFLDEATARQAGYRPCAVCLPRKYREWKLTPRDHRRPEQG
ncbi:MAG: Ada metal-binding domain-containing protein [Angustibacter sp.]